MTILTKTSTHLNSIRFVNLLYSYIDIVLFFSYSMNPSIQCLYDTQYSYLYILYITLDILVNLIYLHCSLLYVYCITTVCPIKAMVGR